MIFRMWFTDSRYIDLDGATLTDQAWSEDAQLDGVARTLADHMTEPGLARLEDTDGRMHLANLAHLVRVECRPVMTPGETDRAIRAHIATRVQEFAETHSQWLSEPTTPSEPRTWNAGDPEPDASVTAVRDREGDVWRREDFGMGGDWVTDGGGAAPWHGVTRYALLTDATHEV